MKETFESISQLEDLYDDITDLINEKYPDGNMHPALLIMGLGASLLEPEPWHWRNKQVKVIIECVDKLLEIKDELVSRSSEGCKKNPAGNYKLRTTIDRAVLYREEHPRDEDSNRAEDDWSAYSA